MNRIKHWLGAPFLTLLILGAAWLLYQSSRAEPVRDQVLEDVSITEINGRIAVVIRLPCPFQTLTHFPQSQGSELRIRIQPAPTCNIDREAFSQRESVRPEHADAAALIAVTYEGDIETGPFISLSFSHAMQWQLQPQNDFRGLAVLVSPAGNESQDP